MLEGMLSIYRGEQVLLIFIIYLKALGCEPDTFRIRGMNCRLCGLERGVLRPWRRREREVREK
jgi:hypothetical protein